MTQEKLINAITNLDSDILDRYFIMKTDLVKKKKSKKHTWIKWASLAACFCIMFISMIFLIPYEPETAPNIQYGYTKEYRLYYKGNKSISKYGTIEFIDFDDNSITLQFEKTTSDYVYATLRGYGIDPSSNTERVYFGTTFSKLQVTEAGIINNGIELFVDNKLASDFPKEAGRYTIRIEYGNLKESCKQLDFGIFISGFGYFVINPLTIEGINSDELIPNSDESIPNTNKTSRFY